MYVELQSNQHFQLLFESYYIGIKQFDQSLCPDATLTNLRTSYAY